MRVKLEEQIPRNALVWIILTQFAMLIPHLGRLPAWVLLLYIAAAGWRVMVYQGRRSFPGGYVKGALTLACCVGVAASYRTLIGLEPTVALLLIAFALKMLELADRRDAYILIFIAYFTCITEFLFTQELLIVLYMLVAVTVNTTALVALHQPAQDRFMPGTLRRAGTMLLQALPLMLLLFFVFPRIGPLWNVPLKSNAARSGMSDFMKPGDIANLSLSDEVAFRAQFDGDIPARRQLYWRGLVLSKLDQGAWRSLRWQDVPVSERREKTPRFRGDYVDYSVIMEPTQQNWLYAIAYASTPDRGIIALNDFRLVSPVEVQDQKRYEVRSWLDVALEPDLSDWRHRIETSLPAAGNPRTRELAQRMFEEAGGDPVRFAQAVLAMFREDAFFYTLRPPILEGDRVDQFLFETRRGFCEHYASAFTWLMRAAGVPARVVAGYQGGEVNPVNGTVIVHQFDAHAWNEIWLEGRGWLQVDPTGAIAPDRIEYGLEEALAEEGSFLAATPLSPLRYRDIDWINALRLRLDAIDYSWQVFVLGFNREAQYDFLNRELGDISRNQLALGVIALWVLLLLPVVLGMLWRSRGRQPDPPTRLYLAFCERLSRAGLQRLPHETPSAYARRVGEARPQLAAGTQAITEAYESLVYDRIQPEDALPDLKRRVRGFRC